MLSRSAPDFSGRFDAVGCGSSTFGAVVSAGACAGCARRQVGHGGIAKEWDPVRPGFYRGMPVPEAGFALGNRYDRAAAPCRTQGHVNPTTHRGASVQSTSAMHPR